jgi:micrococcal nuclease
MKLFLISAFSFFAVCSNACAENCKVTKIADGDSITVQCSRGKEKIRICGIDAPEKKQEFGQASRLKMIELVKGKTVDIVGIQRDRYDRLVAEVFVGDRYINAEMVKSGLAYEYKKYSGGCPNVQKLSDAEAIAKQNQLNLWSGDFVKPWDFRKKN